MTFAEALDSAYIFSYDPEIAVGRKIAVLIRTDSQALFDVLTRSRNTSEKIS